MSYREEDVRELMDAARSLAYTIPIGVPITVQSSLASTVIRVVTRLHSKSLSKNQPEAQPNTTETRDTVVPLLPNDGLYHDCPNGFVLQGWLNELEAVIGQRFYDMRRRLDQALKEISDIKEREAVEFNRKQFVPEPGPIVTGSELPANKPSNDAVFRQSTNAMQRKLSQLEDRIMTLEAIEAQRNRIHIKDMTMFTRDP